MCLVAEQAEEIVGSVVISLVGGSAFGQGLSEMESLAVREDARRRGVGGSLCLQAILRAQMMGAGLMQLEVRSASVAAMALYRSLGFVEQGRRIAYYADPKDDAVMMELPLTQKDA
jgi:ribosomal-protein-alanine N-acetyltransferase